MRSGRQQARVNLLIREINEFIEQLKQVRSKRPKFYYSTSAYTRGIIWEIIKRYIDLHELGHPNCIQKIRTWYHIMNHRPPPTGPSSRRVVCLLQYPFAMIESFSRKTSG